MSGEDSPGDRSDDAKKAATSAVSSADRSFTGAVESRMEIHVDKVLSEAVEERLSTAALKSFSPMSSFSSAGAPGSESPGGMLSRVSTPDSVVSSVSTGSSVGKERAGHARKRSLVRLTHPKTLGIHHTGESSDSDAEAKSPRRSRRKSVEDEGDFDKPSAVPRAASAGPLGGSGSSKANLASSMSPTEYKQFQETKVLRALEKSFASSVDFSKKKGRALVREGELLRIKTFGIIKSPVTVHLFSDAMSISTKSLEGFYMDFFFPLEFCEIRTTDDVGPPYTFVLSCKEVKDITLGAESMKDLLVWVGEIKFFSTRAKNGDIGKPKDWDEDWLNSKFVNKKLLSLKKRRLGRSQSLDELAVVDDEEKEFTTPTLDTLQEELSLSREPSEEKKESKDSKDLKELSFMSATLPVKSKKTIKRSASAVTEEYLHSRARSRSSSIGEFSNFKPNRAKEEDVLPEEVWLEIRRKREKEESLKAKTLKVLIEGEGMMKYGVRGLPQKRFFKVSEDGHELSWGRSKDRKSNMIFIANIVRLEFGPHSTRFQNYRWEKGRGKPWLCFSIHVFDPERTIDIECYNSTQLRTWFLGLQFLMPIWHAFHLSHGELLWTQLLMKLDQEAFDQGVTRSSALVKCVKSKKMLPGNPEEETLTDLLSPPEGIAATFGTWGRKTTKKVPVALLERLQQ